MNFDKALSCLDTALSAWEDSCLSNEILYGFAKRMSQEPPFPREGPLLNWTRFREYLKDASNNAWQEEDFEGVPSIREALGGMHSLPYDLWRWANRGACVLTASKDVCYEKLATVPDALTWQKHPLHELGSVLVVLEQPIMDEEKYEYGCFLLSVGVPVRSESQRHIRLRLFENRVLDYVPFTKEQQHHLEKLRSKQQYEKLLSQLQHRIMSRQKIRLPFIALESGEEVELHQLLLDQPARLPTNAQFDSIDVRPKIGILSQALRVGVAISAYCDPADFTIIPAITDCVARQIRLYSL